jgi:hypothetical protein
MTSTYPAITVLLPAGAAPPRLESVDQAHELLDVGHAFGPHIVTGSRHGGFGGFIRERCEEMGLRGLEFLYCRPWEAPEGCCAFLFQGDDLPALNEALDLVLDWFRANPADFGGAQEVLHALASAPSFEPSLDDEQYIDYLLCLRAFVRRARDEGLAMLYVQWNGG